MSNPSRDETLLLQLVAMFQYAAMQQMGKLPSPMTGKIEREGMVGRLTCDKDGRGCYAVLTEQGQAAVDQARSTYIAVVRARFVRHFSIQEMQDLAGLLARPL